MTSLRPFLKLLNRARTAEVIALFVFMLLSSATEGIGLLLLVPMLDILSGAQTDNAIADIIVRSLGFLGVPSTIGGLLTVFVALVGLRSTVQYSQERLGQTMQHKIVDSLRYDCFSALLNVEWAWLTNTRRSDLASLLLGDINQVGVGLHFGLGLMVTIIAMGAYLSAAFALSPLATLIVLVSGGVVFSLLARHRQQALNLGLDQIKANRALYGDVQESLAGIKLAKILGNEARHLTFLTQTTDALRKFQLEFIINTGFSRALFQTGGALLLAAYLYVGLSVYQLPASELLTLILIFSRMIPMFMTGQQQLHHLIHALPALTESERLLAECRRAAEPIEVSEQSLTLIRSCIQLDNVSFRYATRERAALSDVSLTFPARTTTAIMGASGAGKSTLADTLMGLLEPDRGDIQVDGVSIKGPARRSWRRSVAYVPQDTFLFQNSIRQNLLWGNPDARETDIARALEQAAARFVFDLPQGLETIVGDNGLRLSGGERQRIALARALLKRPSLLILDEATSALDVENESKIRMAIEQLHGDLTVVIIGHRLPTLEHADQVVVLDDGRVLAQGAWSDVRKAMEPQ
jgi:ATP-binding cassette subfamily C protein